jgi:hypothetical protein
MSASSSTRNQIQNVSSIQDLLSVPFDGEVNALCWNRELKGDFLEIVKKLQKEENIVEITVEDLSNLQLSEEGKIAREIILSDWKALTDHGASPILNIIKHYERDDVLPTFPTDVYSFHVDRSPIPTSTFLCTYYGEASEILPNQQAVQKVMIPKLRKELKKLHAGNEEGFEMFLRDHFFDLHYEALTKSQLIKLGKGQLWRLAVDHPESQVLPCIHRAPLEKKGESRLLLIC